MFLQLDVVWLGFLHETNMKKSITNQHGYSTTNAMIQVCERKDGFKNIEQGGSDDAMLSTNVDYWIGLRSLLTMGKQGKPCHGG